MMIPEKRRSDEERKAYSVADVAEMSAAFLCGMSGIEHKTLENSAAYIRGWLKALKNDKTLLVMASSQGQKAADYILDRHEQQELVEAA
jgi:antirestriction protein ArdC